MSARTRWTAAAGLAVAMASAAVAIAAVSTDHISVSAGSEEEPAYWLATSFDGSRTVFLTDESLTDDDADGGAQDIYVREGDTTRLLTPDDGDNISDSAVAVYRTRSNKLLFRHDGDIAGFAEDDDDIDGYVYDVEADTLELVTPGTTDSAHPDRISEDGSTVLFQSHESFDGDADGNFGDLYAGRDGAYTLLSEGSEETCPSEQNAFRECRPGSIGVGLSDDGSRALVFTGEQLADGDTDIADDAYLVDLGSPGTHTLITGAHAYDIRGTGNNGNLPSIIQEGTTFLFDSDLDTVFFTADGSLAGAGDTNNERDLYRWTGSGIEFIAHDAQVCRITADGQTATIVTEDALGGGDADALDDLYRWRNAATDEWIRITDGGTSTCGPLSADGETALFSSHANHTGETEVVEYEDTFRWSSTGGTTLVTPGTSDTGANMWGGTSSDRTGAATDSLSHVLIVTAQALAAEDDDELRDLYVASTTSPGDVTFIGGGSETADGVRDGVTPRFLAADAGRAVYMADGPVLGSDTDDELDVYGWGTDAPPVDGTATPDPPGDGSPTPGPGGGTPTPGPGGSDGFTATEVIALPAKKRCVRRRRITVRVTAPAGVPLAKAVLRAGKRRKTVTGAALGRKIVLRKVPRKRFTLRVAVTAQDGRTVRRTRRYRGCKKS